jgi:hypothetical protein
MVKSPDLLRGLLDKKVDRCKMLKIAGFTGALAALAACSGNKYPAENKPANPSTADIPMRTADAQPTPPPTPEATPTPEAETPIDLSEIVPEDKLREKLVLPNFKEVRSRYRWDSDACQEIAVALIDAINCLTCPTVLNQGTDRVFGQYVTKEGTSGYLADSICDHVKENFIKLTMSSDALDREGVPEFFDWVSERCYANVGIAVDGNANEEFFDHRVAPLTEGREFYRIDKVTPKNEKGDIAEASVLPDNTVRLVWDTCAKTNLDPSDPRYAVMDPENDRRRFTAYLDKTSAGELSIKKIAVEELTGQTRSK